jgi:hypothetical protein
MIKMQIGLHVKYTLTLSDFNETRIFWDRFWKKYSNIKFHENLSSGSRFIPFGETDGRTDMTKLMIAFYSLANAPKISYTVSRSRENEASVEKELTVMDPLYRSARATIRSAATEI